MKIRTSAALVAALLALAACGGESTNDSASRTSTTQARSTTSPRPTTAPRPTAAPPKLQSYYLWANRHHAELTSVASTKLQLIAAIDHRDRTQVAFLSGALTQKFDNLFWTLSEDKATSATPQGRDVLDAFDICATATGDLALAIESGLASAIGDAAVQMDQCDAELYSSQALDV
jgi:hypothetical protein